MTPATQTTPIPRTGTKYKLFTQDCPVCGKTFTRSAPVNCPPKMCSMDCRTIYQTGKSYNRKYDLDDHQISLIRKLYATGTDRGEQAELAKKLKVPVSCITNVARKHGWLTRSVGHKKADWFWSDEELKILQNNPDCSAVTMVRKLKKAGYNRTLGAIEYKRAMLRVCQNRSGMTAESLAEAMGVDAHKILNAIKSGKIKSKKRQGYTYRVPNVISAKAARDYILDYLPEININLCDKYWLVDLLSMSAADLREAS